MAESAAIDTAKAGGRRVVVCRNSENVVSLDGARKTDNEDSSADSARVNSTKSSSKDANPKERAKAKKESLKEFTRRSSIVNLALSFNLLSMWLSLRLRPTRYWCA